MEFFDVVATRRSVRAFKPDKIEDEKLAKILETMNSAPSAGNLQGYEVVVVKNNARKDKLTNAAWGQSFISEAPVVLVFFANPSRSGRKYGARGEKLYALQDATIAVSYAQLAATALGLGSVWVGAFNDREVSRAVDAPDELQPVAILPIGYPDEVPVPTDRRMLSEIVRHETFSFAKRRM